MFFAVGAIGLLSAALISAVTGLDFDILAGASLFLMFGRFHRLDRLSCPPTSPRKAC